MFVPNLFSLPSHVSRTVCKHLSAHPSFFSISVSHIFVGHDYVYFSFPSLFCSIFFCQFKGYLNISHCVYCVYTATKKIKKIQTKEDQKEEKYSQSVSDFLLDV